MSSRSPRLSATTSDPSVPEVHGRYALYEALGTGGNASVHLGIARGESVPLAIKRLHDRKSGDAGPITRLLDEVRLSRHIVHPNVVRVLDFVSDGEAMLAVMEYVHAEPLSRLLASARKSRVLVPRSIAAAIMRDLLRGLHAAHEATDSSGKPLNIVHRDVTPENVLVGADGVTRLSDFGVAKATGRLDTTRDGGIRGKLLYMAPEQIGGDVTRRTDIYAAGLVLWEALVGERALQGASEAAIIARALSPDIPPPSTRAIDIPPELDHVVCRALAPNPDERFATAAEFADALERASPSIASADEVAAWIRDCGGERLAQREAAIAAMLDSERALAVPRAAPRTASGVSRRSIVFASVAAAAVAGVGAWRMMGQRPEVPTAPLVSPSPPAASSTAPQPIVSAPRREPTVAAAPIDSAPPSMPSASSARRVRPRATPKPSTANCDPPWVLDENGIRRYDPACIR